MENMSLLKNMIRTNDLDRSGFFISGYVKVFRQGHI